MKEGFKTVEEILLEVAKDEGMTLKEVNDVWKHQKVYIKKQMEKEGVYSIFLPSIGTLSLNVKQYTKEIKGKAKSFYKDFINKVEKLLQHEKYSEFGNAHKKVTGVNRLARYIIGHYDTGIKRTKKIIEHKNCWDIITKYSNGAFEKNK
jgi:hypothetical protein